MIARRRHTGAMGGPLLLLLLLAAAGAVALSMTTVVLLLVLRARRVQARQRTPQAIAVDARPQPASRTTCPFCRDDVAEGEGVVCARCLARQHEGCWDEGGACATCRHVERHGRVERARAS